MGYSLNVLRNEVCQHKEVTEKKVEMGFGHVVLSLSRMLIRTLFTSIHRVGLALTIFLSQSGLLF